MMPDPLSQSLQDIGRLSAKQRECLDLVLERLTSKQIAQRLNISRHTVDQRLDSARRALGAQTRIEAAIIYDRIRCGADRPSVSHVSQAEVGENARLHDPSSYERFTYDPFLVGGAAQSSQDAAQPGGSRLLTLEDAAQMRPLAPWEKDAVIRPFAGSLVGFSETVRRLILIVGISLLMMAVAIVALALAESLTRLISG